MDGRFATLAASAAASHGVISRDDVRRVGISDTTLRLRLVGERRLADRAVERHSSGVNGGRLLLDVLGADGGESRLERRFLAMVRRTGLASPQRQVVHRDGRRFVARVDFLFGPDLVVEVAGHGAHAGRRQRQRDAQRHTELTLAGRRVLTFTYEDVSERPEWVRDRLIQGGVARRWTGRRRIPLQPRQAGAIARPESPGLSR
jgi:very-short-patch-repair endonuclease